MKCSIPTRRPTSPRNREFAEASDHLKAPINLAVRDTWVFKGKEYKIVEGAIPSAIASAFTIQVNQKSSAAPYDYDREKILVYCMSSLYSHEFSARIELVATQFLADVNLKDNRFKIDVYLPDKENFPLSTSEFVKAVNAAKLDLLIDDEDSAGDDK